MKKQTVTNVFGGETNGKTFNLYLIKALKDNECEKVRIIKRVCACVGLAPAH